MRRIIIAMLYALSCTYLYAGTVTFTATPQRGTIPLTVTVYITWTDIPGANSYSVDGGDDLDGNGGPCMGQTSGIVATSVTYHKVGTYPMIARVTDSLSAITYSTATYITVDALFPTVSNFTIAGSATFK